MKHPTYRSMRSLAVVLAVFATAAVFTSCRGSLWDNGSSGLADVRLSVTIPDYFNYHGAAYSRAGETTQPRLIDPSTFFIDISVSADDMDTINQVFSLDSSNYSSSGLWTIDCHVRNIPAGEDRLITITTRDIAGNALTIGTITVTLAAGDESGLGVTLTPAEASEASVGGTIVGNAAFGEMSYHYVLFSTTGNYRITLLSSKDVDLYIFTGDGKLQSADSVQRGSPTDEQAGITITEVDTSLFIGVFGFENEDVIPYSVEIENADPPDRVPVFKTGQTTSYLTGDDGDLQRGRAWPSPRFTVNGNGTITDSMTGLMWEAAPDTSLRTWEDALAYANGSTIGTYTDWRLPNVFELESLYNYSLAWAAPQTQADWLASAGFSNVAADWYWTSTTQPSTTTAAYIFDFDYPASTTRNKPLASTRAFICRGSSDVLPRTGQTSSYTATEGEDGDIQAGVPWPAPRFTNNGDNTVTDNLTGLMWEQGPSTTDVTLADALTYVDIFAAGGHMDWRLPNVRELLTLVDYSALDVDVWLNANGFSDVLGASYWTSTREPGLDLTFSHIIWIGPNYSLSRDYVTNANCPPWPVRGGE